MRRSLLLILLLAWPWAVGAQPAAPVLPTPPNRFLFIVDTSDSAPGWFQGAMQAVQDLLGSGIGGQAHEGDSVGVWTFNESAMTRHFPLQHWSVSQQRVITSRALVYLKAQKSPERTGLEKMLPEMNHVINESAYITVILISDGTEAIHGTPFDKAINAAYKKWHREQQKAKRPFVTVLQGKDGQFTGYAVTPAQWAIEMPALPPELSKGNMRQELLATLENTQPAARDLAKPAVPAPPRDKPQPTAGEEPPLVPGVISSTVLPPDEPASPNAATSDSKPPATSDSKVPATTAQPAAPMSENSSPVPPSQKSELAQSTVPPPTIQLIPPPSPVSKPPGPAATPAQEVSKPASVAAAGTPPNVVAKTAPRPPEPSKTPPQQSIAAVSSTSLLKRKELWISAVVFVGATLGLIFLLVRRSRTADRVSLITQSLERQKER
jgi:hypothetical protein